MAKQLRIDPHTVYDEGAISLALDIPLSTLLQARRTGQLRFSRKGRRVLILGEWLIAWLTADAQSRGKELPHAG